MLKMSFYDGTLDRDRAKEVIAQSEKPCRYTFGLGYRNPTTNRKPLTTEEAMNIIDNESLLDITEMDEFFHLNAYSSNDMW